jgi:hypothetical protein
MRSFWQRLSASVTLVVFLITSTPGAAQAASGYFRGSATPCSCPFCSDPAGDDDCKDDGDHPGRVCRPDRPSPEKHGPASPFDPYCPNPACWCHVAHTAYCPDGPFTLLIELHCQGPNVAEADLLSPSPHPAELMKPPRA